MFRCVKDILGRYLTIECECCDIASHRLLPAGNRIYENDNIVIYTNLTVPLLGFIVVAPKKHVERFADLDFETNVSMAENALKVVNCMRDLKIAEDFSILKFEDEYGHCKMWILPFLNGIFENNFDFRLLENRYSMERRRIPIAAPHEILFLNRRLRSLFEEKESETSQKDEIQKASY